MMKIKIEIKNRWTGAIIFEYEKENNTIIDTLSKAVKNNAYLIGAYLSDANLSGANLSDANLSGAYLSGANLSGAYLSGANLSGAYLRDANLSGANLRDANLRDANLRDANLSGAYLSGANLSGAYLSGANLRDANLRGAYLSGANLSGAYLSGAKGSDLAIAITRLIPEGDIIGYKKCRDNIIVKLLIPKEAKRNNAFGRKCRAEYADVLEIFGAEKAYSSYDRKIVYEVGKRMIPKEPFDENFLEECSSGIHFFITKLEAENYNL